MLRGIAAAAAVLWAGCAPAWAQDVMGIAAVVNDRAISMFDLEARIDIAIYNANLARTDDMRRQAAGPVLRNLIDEALQAEEARSKGIRVTDRDVAEAVRRIEEGNGVPRGGLEGFLAERGIAVGAVLEQIRARVAWAKYVNLRIRPAVSVSEDEIDEEIARLEGARGRPEYLVSEIVLYDDPAAGPDGLPAVAAGIVRQLRGGADFAAVAAQFGQGALAREGGDLGWVQEGQSRAEIDRALAAMAVGAVSDPVRAAGAWHILHLRDKRETMAAPEDSAELFLSQILFPADEESPGGEEDRLALARDAAAGARGCDALRARGAELEDSLSGDIGWTAPADLPAAFRGALDGLEVGAASAPVTTANGVHVVMICERRGGGDGGDGLRDRIYERIVARRLAIVERRLLRDLRRAAFVDIRA